MRFASALSTISEPALAADEAAYSISAQLQNYSTDLLMVYLGGTMRLDARLIAQRLRGALSPQVMIGCTAEGVIGRDAEIEGTPAVAVVAAHLPGVSITPISLNQVDWRTVLAGCPSFKGQLGLPSSPKLFMLLVDPYSVPLDEALRSFNLCYPDVPVVGGVASGARRPGENVMLLNDEAWPTGAVGVALDGAMEVDVIVSQGCRPIGEAFTVTEADGNLILSLDGISPALQIAHMIEALPVADKALLHNGLFIGRAVTSPADDLGRGDFLIRSVLGLDQETGAIAIGDYISIGDRVQFQLRDAQTAAEDLDMLLAPQMLYEAPAGGFLFSCNGRGTRLYDHPDGDISRIQEALGVIEMGGFFCAGEIGPVGGKNFLHGHTASMVLFRQVKRFEG